jgi:hypothetical protein
VRTAVAKGTNRVGLFFRSPENLNRSIFRNVVFTSYLEFRTMVKIHKPSDSECYTPWAELFAFYQYVSSLVLISHLLKGDPVYSHACTR